MIMILCILNYKSTRRSRQGGKHCRRNHIGQQTYLSLRWKRTSVAGKGGDTGVTTDPFHHPCTCLVPAVCYSGRRVVCSYNSQPTNNVCSSAWINNAFHQKPNLNFGTRLYPSLEHLHIILSSFSNIVQSS